MSSQEVQDAVGEAPARDKDEGTSTSLEQRAAELRRVVEAPSRAEAELKEIEARIAEQKEQAAKDAATRRCLAISRAVGSVVSEIEDDATRVEKAADAYREAVSRMNDRFRQYELLIAENEGALDRFPGIKGAKLPESALPPDRHPIVIQAARTVDAVAYAKANLRSEGTERCEDGQRQRRTYGEIAGTPMYAIIAQAGLKAWPELTESQRERIAERTEDAERQQRFIASLAVPTAQALIGERIL